MIDAVRTPWTDVAAHLAGGHGIAVLPFGALEQHGPHLPLGTDTVTAAYVARQIATRLDAVLLPPVHYGDTWNNAGYPGTLSLAPSTVTAIAVDLGRALAASGVQRLAIAPVSVDDHQAACTGSGQRSAEVDGDCRDGRRRK